MNQVLRVEALSVSRPAASGTRVLSEVDIAVARGEIVAISGPSGSGKTTLLHSIAGLVPIDSGNIEVGGRVVTDLPVHRRGVGLVFQEGYLFPHRSVRGNVSFALEIKGLARRLRKRRVVELMELLDFTELADRKTSTLSGGQRQRVALARALAAEPELLLLDEPMSALDSVARGELGEKLVDTLRHTGTTALLVTHDSDEASRLSDRVIRLDNGRVTA